MQHSYEDLLKKNSLSILESKNQIQIRSNKSRKYFVIALIVGLSSIVTGLLANNLEVEIISLIVSITCIVMILFQWNGKAKFIIDKLNSKLIFPSNNKYESATEIQFNEVSKVSIEQVGQAYFDQEVNYVFLKRFRNEPEHILTLRTKEEDQLALKDLKNWLEAELDRK